MKSDFPVGICALCDIIRSAGSFNRRAHMMLVFIPIIQKRGAVVFVAIQSPFKLNHESCQFGGRYGKFNELYNLHSYNGHCNLFCFTLLCFTLLVKSLFLLTQGLFVVPDDCCHIYSNHSQQNVYKYVHDCVTHSLTPLKITERK